MDKNFSGAMALTAALFSGPLHSIPMDNFLSAETVGDDFGQFEVELGKDFTTDKVAYSPNTESGGYLTPDSRPRYLGQHFAFKAQLTSRIMLDGGVWQRQVTSLRDSYSLNTFHGAIQYALTAPKNETSIAVRFGAWQNSSDVFYKNSYTRQGDYLFTSASVLSPNDLQTQINLIGTRGVTIHRHRAQQRRLRFIGCNLSLRQRLQIPFRLPG